jgi:hypothetical protein
MLRKPLVSHRMLEKLLLQTRYASSSKYREVIPVFFWEGGGRLATWLRQTQSGKADQAKGMNGGVWTGFTGKAAAAADSVPGPARRCEFRKISALGARLWQNCLAAFPPNRAPHLQFLYCIEDQLAVQAVLYAQVHFKVFLCAGDAQRTKRPPRFQITYTAFLTLWHTTAQKNLYSQLAYVAFSDALAHHKSKIPCSNSFPANVDSFLPSRRYNIGPDKAIWHTAA